MSKAVLLSIKPQFCELIASGKKTIEVRKTKPKIETPFKCYIYCTTDKRLLRKFDKGERIDDEHFFDEHVFVRQNTWIRGTLNPNKKVIGEFVCDFVDEYIYDYCTHPEIGMDYDCGDNWWEISEEDLENACLTEEEFRAYAFPKELMHGWHISDLVIYDKPKELREFYTSCDVMRCEFCDLWGSVRVNAEEFDMDCKSDWFMHKPLKRPPQSWCYVEELEVD